LNKQNLIDMDHYVFYYNFTGAYLLFRGVYLNKK